MNNVAPSTPVLVGVGIVAQREQDPARAREAVALMSDALSAAGDDCGVAALPAQAQAIYVPQGLWSYQNPAGMIAEAVGASAARSVLGKIGITQQALIDQACRSIAEGNVEVAVVAGGEARYRALRASINGVEAAETESGSLPDEALEPEAELYHEAEVAALGHMPVGYYAIIESAIRAHHGRGMEQHLPGLEGILVLDAGHFVSRERPVELAQAMMWFYNSMLGAGVPLYDRSRAHGLPTMPVKPRPIGGVNAFKSAD